MTWPPALAQLFEFQRSVRRQMHNVLCAGCAGLNPEKGSAL